MTPKDLIGCVGGPSKLASALGVRHSTPLNWKAIPPHHCPVIEQVFGIPREELRPDLFDRRPAPAPAEVGG